MNPKAVADATFQLELARAAVANLERIYSIREPVELKTIEREWRDFLEAFYTIYAKLQKGSQGHQKSEPWFGAKLYERRKDELLAYLYQARNSEKHGLEDSTKRQTFGITPVGEGIKKLEDGSYITNNPNITIRVHLPGVFFVPVTDDRYGTIFPVPASHLGKPFQSRRPLETSRAAVSYLEALVAEARLLPS